jgi:hypothetical protein
MAGASTSYPRAHRHNHFSMLCWSCATGAVLVLSFILLYVGVRHLHANQFLWQVDVGVLLVTLIGSGLLVGCIAVIGNHFMRSRY